MPDNISVNRLNEFVDLLASNIPNWHEQANIAYCKERIRGQSENLLRELYADIEKGKTLFMKFHDVEKQCVLMSDIRSAFERFGVKIGE